MNNNENSFISNILSLATQATFSAGFGVFGMVIAHYFGEFFLDSSLLKLFSLAGFFVMARIGGLIDIAVNRFIGSEKPISSLPSENEIREIGENLESNKGGFIFFESDDLEDEYYKNQNPSFSDRIRKRK